MISVPSIYRDLVERRAANKNADYSAMVREFAYTLPVSIQNLFVAHAHLSDAEMDFGFGYTAYYMKTRNGKIIADQLYWSTKYALTIAPLMVRLHTKDELLSSSYIGEFVEYSFSSFRMKSKPDPAHYDIGMVCGAVILRSLPFPHRDIEPDSADASEIGASWEIVMDHWEHLKRQKASYLLTFVKNVRDGGAVALSDGAL